MTGCKPKPAIAQSVGWLVSQNAKAILVVPHIVDAYGEKQGCGDMTIPTACIRRITLLTHQRFRSRA
jgi:hypothetical protein